MMFKSGLLFMDGLIAKKTIINGSKNVTQGNINDEGKATENGNKKMF